MRAVLRIRALRDGFRRGGRAWPAAWTEIAAGELDAAQLAAIEAEPMLVVERVEPGEAHAGEVPPAADRAPARGRKRA